MSRERDEALYTVAVGRVIFTLRGERTQVELADAAGITQAQISRIEAGVAILDLRDLGRIAAALYPDDRHRVHLLAEIDDVYRKALRIRLPGLARSSSAWHVHRVRCEIAITNLNMKPARRVRRPRGRVAKQ